jgi:hypothetical protein
VFDIYLSDPACLFLAAGSAVSQHRSVAVLQRRSVAAWKGLGIVWNVVIIRPQVFSPSGNCQMGLRPPACQLFSPPFPGSGNGLLACLLAGWLTVCRSAPASTGYILYSPSREQSARLLWVEMGTKGSNSDPACSRDIPRHHSVPVSVSVAR